MSNHAIEVLNRMAYDGLAFYRECVRRAEERKRNKAIRPMDEKEIVRSIVGDQYITEEDVAKIKGEVLNHDFKRGDYFQVLMPRNER